MKNASSQLAIVRSNETTLQTNSPVIEDILRRWQDVNTQLRTLYVLEDEYLSEPNEETSAGAEIYSQIEAMERIQRNLLRKLTHAPAENRQDMATKLEVWKKIVMPEEVSPADAQPTDLLVCSVLDAIAGELSN